MKRIFNPENIRFERGFDNSPELAEFLTSLDDEVRGLSFVGRSNVGKSSLINALFKNGLAKVSNTPGRTREINLFSFSSFGQKTFFFDLPGYGYAKASKAMQKSWQQLISTFFECLPPKLLIINIQDARHPFQKADEEFLRLFDAYDDLFGFLIFNKMDKLKTQKERAALNKMKTTIMEKAKSLREIYFLSAQTRAGLDVLEERLNTYFSEDS